MCLRCHGHRLSFVIYLFILKMSAFVCLYIIGQYGEESGRGGEGYDTQQRSPAGSTPTKEARAEEEEWCAAESATLFVETAMDNE